MTWDKIVWFWIFSEKLNSRIFSMKSTQKNIKLFAKFRQSNVFTKELHCKLISREFFEVGVNFPLCGNLKIFPHDFLQKFRQSNFFAKKLYCKLISRKFFQVGVNFRHYLTHCVSIILTLFSEKISWK